jgi:undecaprenyl-diphosphatase
MAETIAELMGTYALETILLLIVIISLAILGAWWLFETYQEQLWHRGGRLLNQIKQWALLRRVAERFPGLWSFLARRFSPEDYLGLHLTIGLLITLIGIQIFSTLSDIVIEQEGLIHFDQLLSVALHQQASPFEIALFRGVTALGGSYVTTTLGIGVGLLLFTYRRRLLAISWLIMVFGGGLVNLGLKAIFQRPRPTFDAPILTEHGWSFPSGHAMGSLIIYGMLAYLLIIWLDHSWDKLIIVLAVTVILLIGFSRIYLGVHYFSDVVAGFAAGLGWLAIGVSGIEIARRHQTMSSQQVTTEKDETLTHE